MKAKAVQTRLMLPEDIPQVAKIHFEALPNDFLPSLGLKYLREGFYKSMLNNPYASVVVAHSDAEICGFSVVAQEPEKFFPWVLKQNRLATFRGLCRLAFKPQRILEAFWLNLAMKAPMPQGGEIAFIAVAPEHQGKGIGQAIMRASDTYFVNKNLNQGFTKTRANNQKVFRLNKARNAKVLSQFKIHNESYVYLSWKLVVPN